MPKPPSSGLRGLINSFADLFRSNKTKDRETKRLIANSYALFKQYHVPNAELIATPDAVRKNPAAFTAFLVMMTTLGRTDAQVLDALWKKFSSDPELKAISDASRKQSTYAGLDGAVGKKIGHSLAYLLSSKLPNDQCYEIFIKANNPQEIQKIIDAEKAKIIKKPTRPPRPLPKLPPQPEPKPVDELSERVANTIDYFKLHKLPNITEANISEHPQKFMVFFEIVGQLGDIDSKTLAKVWHRVSTDSHLTLMRRDEDPSRIIETLIAQLKSMEGNLEGESYLTKAQIYRIVANTRDPIKHMRQIESLIPKLLDAKINLDFLENGLISTGTKIKQAKAMLSLFEKGMLTPSVQEELLERQLEPQKYAQKLIERHEAGPPKTVTPAAAATPAPSSEASPKPLTHSAALSRKPHDEAAKTDLNEKPAEKPESPKR